MATEFIIHDSTDNDLLFPREFARGCVERDPTWRSEGGVQAVEFPLIDPSEYSDRIKERKEQKATFRDLRRRSGPNGGIIPSLDQNGQGYCVTEDTEVLTERGWVAFPKYNWTDPIATVNPVTHTMEFQEPFEQHVYEYDGPMLYSTNRRLDFGVTPDHQMYVRKWDEAKRTLSDRYSFVRAGDLGWYSGLLAAPSGCIGTEIVEVEVPGDRRYDGDDLIMLLAIVASDGYAGGSESTKNWVSFCCFREDTIGSVRALAARTGFQESPSRPGVFIRYSAGALASWLREVMYVGGEGVRAAAKKVPLLVKSSSARQIRLFLTWFNDRSRDGQSFYSTSRVMMDDLQELHLKIGRRSTISAKSGSRTTVMHGDKDVLIRSDGGYTLVVSNTDRLCIDRKKHIEMDRYKGLVYCAGVPNHTLLTRRNGSVLVSSNCWGHSATMANMVLRMNMGLPYVRLSAFAVCCIIKNYRDEGGWGALALDFITSRGVPSVAFWPEKSMSREHDKPATWENAALHKVTEGWVDLGSSVYDRNLAARQIETLLLLGIPVIGDFAWWGHSVCLTDLEEVERGSYGYRGINSWTDGWGDQGEFVLQGSKKQTMGATAPRSTVVSYV